MVRIILLLLAFFFVLPANGRSAGDIELNKINDNVYVYTAWSMINGWGLIGSNGMVVTGGEGRALLVDTPMDEVQTVQLLSILKDSIGVTITDFVPGHWHSDCVGGMDYLSKNRVLTYANKITNDILRQKNRPVSLIEFTDSTTLNLGGPEIGLYYLGGGHSVDNIVVWHKSEKILFGGCMVKARSEEGMGNLEDAAPLEQWVKSIDAISKRFYDAQIIIPGHGQYGGLDLLEYTKKLIKKNIK